MLDFGYVSVGDVQPDLTGLCDSGVIAFDAETSGVRTEVDVPYGFSIAHRESDAYYTTMHNTMFTDIISDESKTKIAHNAKFDRSMFKRHGIIIDNLCDPMIAAHLLEEQRLSLKYLLTRMVPEFNINIKQFPEFPIPIPHADLQTLASHFAPHSSGALILWQRLEKLLRANRLWDVFWRTEMPLVPVLSDMELNGTLIDQPYLNGLGTRFQAKIDAIESVLRYRTGHPDANFNSADQAAKILYDELNVPKPPRHMKKLWTTGGRPSCDKSWLIQFVDKFPIVKLYLEYKHLRHLKDTYVNGIEKRLVDGRIHTNFNQTRTRTGRLSSTDPNLQNIPSRDEVGRQIRRAFIAPEGKSILKADYIQMELKKEAILSNCKAMIDAFLEGRDIHKETAIRMWNDPSRRADGKTQNFRLIYGGGDEREQQLLFNAYPEVKTWMDRMLKEFEIMGYAKTMRGRKEHLGDMATMNSYDKAHAHRQGLSVMNQGSCAEIVKEAMRRVWEKTRDSEVKMLLQVHDEVVLEVPNKDLVEVYHLLHKEMTFTEEVLPFTIDIKLGHSWGDAKEVTYENGALIPAKK